MKLHRFTLLLGLAAAAAEACAQPAGRERNAWPLRVERAGPAGGEESSSAAGPFAFSRTLADGSVQRGVRPFWVETLDARGDLRSAQVLYPLFFYSADEARYQWSFLNLMNRAGRRGRAGAPASELEQHEGFDLWPIWFSRRTADPATSHQALFPLGGTLRRRLGYDRLAWTLWPLYFESEKQGVITTSAPWPFIRVVHGNAKGFAVWPLYGRQDRNDGSHREFFLWPLGYSRRAPAADGGPETRQYAALPFYAHDSGPGYVGETFFWPFFGYTIRTTPERHHETRYFWPLLVQGRGDARYLNRWAPLFSRSVAFGYEKTWIAWPLWRELKWTSQGVAQTKTQLLYFVYWSLEQRSPTQPDRPGASITHLWPLVSAWDNGAGRRQWQFPSPLEVFFPGNEKCAPHGRRCFRSCATTSANPAKSGPRSCGTRSPGSIANPMAPRNFISARS
jgi:hypothetical protein